MGMIAFLKRLTGGSEADQATESKFQARLHGTDDQLEELDHLKDELDTILDQVSVQQETIKLSDMTMGPGSPVNQPLRRSNDRPRQDSDYPE